MLVPQQAIRNQMSRLGRASFVFSKRKRRAYRLFKNFPCHNYGTILDIGAYNGEFTDLATVMFKPQRVILVEADPVSAQRLTKRYRSTPHCQVIHGAVADKEQPFKLRINASRDSSSILPICQVAEATFGQDLREVDEIDVPGITLDGLFERLGLDSVDLMKVDIQGAEKRMIQGGQRALEKVKSLYIEVSFEEFYRECATFEELDRMLKSFGFKLRSLNECRIGSDCCLAYANAHYLRV